MYYCGKVNLSFSKTCRNVLNDRVSNKIRIGYVGGQLASRKSVVFNNELKNFDLRFLAVYNPKLPGPWLPRRVKKTTNFTIDMSNSKYLTRKHKFMESELWRT